MSAAAPAVLISLGSFGASEVRRHGQHGFAALAADAGADGVEVRGELLSDAPTELRAIGALARERGLGLVYSSPEGLWSDAGCFDDAAVMRALDAARLLGAPRLKMSIGAYPASGAAAGDTAAGFQRLARLLADSGVELVIENDQTESAGTLRALQCFFATAQAAGLTLGMTFDMGNWHWTGEDPLLAAEAFAARVCYVHCKGVLRQPHESTPGRPKLTQPPWGADDAGRRPGGTHKWAAVPLAQSAAPWRAVLRRLPADVPRAIEFPLQGDGDALLDVTSQQIALVRSAEVMR